MTNHQEREFARLRLQGTRFQSAGVPVAALPELIAYQELVTEVAKALFFRGNPARRRVPKGFEERLGLRLTALESGSVVPVLVRADSDELLGLFGDLHIDDEYELARDLVAAIPAAVAQREDVPEGFPDVPDRVLARFGQTLREDESIELAMTGAWSPPYTPRLRRQLLLHRQDSYTASAALVGVLAEVNFESNQFALRTDDGFRVSLPYDNGSFEVIAATVQPTPQQRVQVEGTVVFDQYDRPLRVDTINSVALAADEAVQQAYDEARGALAGRVALAAGWLGGDEGEPVTERAQTAANSLLGVLEDGGNPAPRVYPTPEGGVSLEWTVEGRHVVAEVGPLGVLWLHQTDPAAGDLDEKDLPADGNVAVAARWLQPRLSTA